MHFMENKGAHGGEEKLEADLIEYTPDSPYIKIKKLDINWTLAKSDHAAVILTLEHRHKIRTRNEHIKLDNLHCHKYRVTSRAKTIS